MRFEARTIILKNGKQCVLRPAEPDDALAMIDYLKQTAAETPFLLRYPEEWNLTEEKEREILGGLLESERNVMMVALVEGQLAGNCALNPVGGVRRVLHRSRLAIALKQDYWNLGIGRAMMEYLTELAARMRYEQIELEVIEGNTRAKILYEKCGFVETGKNVNAIKYDDGSYRDEYIMIKQLNEDK